jgi:hypothetical protein
LMNPSFTQNQNASLKPTGLVFSKRGSSRI